LIGRKFKSIWCWGSPWSLSSKNNIAPRRSRRLYTRTCSHIALSGVPVKRFVEISCIWEASVARHKALEDRASGFRKGGSTAIVGIVIC
jgi:hypothetical protein